MNNRAFLEELYGFLKENDRNGYYKDSDPEDCIEELENYLSDVEMVKETIKDIEEIADSFDDHEVYITEVRLIKWHNDEESTDHRSFILCVRKFRLAIRINSLLTFR